MKYFDKVIDGRKISAELMDELKSEITKIKELGDYPKLCVIIIGENPSALAYVRMIEKSCTKVEMAFEVLRLPVEIKEEELLFKIEELNKNNSVHGILIQMPLPKQICEENILNAIDYRKDVDGFNPKNAGKLLAGQDTYIPCTPGGIAYTLDYCKFDLSGKHAVVIGRSNIVGKPIALLLLERNATVTICHSRTVDMGKYTKDADIIVVAVGIPLYLKREMIKKDAIIIDVGINEVDGKIVGDVDYENVKSLASYITPVPGGVGSTTIAILIKNTLKAFKLLR